MIEFSADSDGIGVFNAIAIGLGVELISGRVHAKRNTPGYQKLLEQFALYHPNFNPVSWEHFLEWLAYYNNPRDLQLILAPVLFNLNQFYRAQQDIEQLVLEELVQLIAINKDLIQQDSVWHDLKNKNLFAELDALSIEIRANILAELKTILVGYSGTTIPAAKDLLNLHPEITQAIIPCIDLSKANYDRAYYLTNLALNDALALNLTNSLIPHVGKVNIMVRSKIIPDGVLAGQSVWVTTTKNFDEELLADNDFFHLAKKSIQQAMSPEYRSDLPDITTEQVRTHKDRKIKIARRLVDNPGRGNCGFYAFAIGLIHIIQQQGPSNYAMFQHWHRLVPTLSDYCHGADAMEQMHKQLLAFDFKHSLTNKKLLDHLQMGLRYSLYEQRINELKQSCAMAAVDVNHMLANTTYMDFSVLFSEESLAIDRAAGDNIFADSKELVKKIAAARVSGVEPISFFIQSLYGADAKLEDISIGTELDYSLLAVQALANIKKDTVWATSQDLQKLALFFNVNYYMLQNGVPRQVQVNRDNLPVITLNCLSRTHWQTQIYEPVELNTNLPKPLSKDNLVKSNLPPANAAPSQQSKTADTTVASAKNTHSIVRSAPAIQSTRKRVNTNKPEGVAHDGGLEHLQTKLTKATIDYTSYSESIWFSFFHRHGQTGRNRAQDFHSSFSAETDYDKARQDLLIYLRNPKNGNTHPHSYRTMLLHELIKEKYPLHSLHDTSKKYNELLQELATTLDPYPVFSL